MEQPPNNKQFKHKCELDLLVCEPNPFRPDRITVGLVLRDSNPDRPRVMVRYAQDLSSVQCIYPQADIEAIESNLLEMQTVLENVTDVHRHLQLLPADCPVDFELITGKAVLTDDMEAELRLLEEQYLSPAALSGLEKQRTRGYGRLYLRREIQNTFRELGVWEYLDKSISADQYVLKGDSLNIDLGYLNKRTSTYRMIHAVSLVTSLDRARILTLSWPAIKSGKEQESGKQCELFAIVEAGMEHNAQTKNAWNWMQESGIKVNSLNALHGLGGDIRSALEL